MLDVMVYALSGNSRSQKLARAFAEGAGRAGYNPKIQMDNQYRKPHGVAAAFYGYQKTMPRIMEEYLAAGRKVVFADLGYWGRHEGGRFRGYHKISINARHPGDYLMALDRGPERFQRFGLQVRKWRGRGEHIILAGMSAKSAESLGYESEEWETWAASEIRKYSDREIIYRPKPSWPDAKGVPGAVMQRGSNLEHVLDNCHATVAHHSNVSVDGLLAGVPAFCWEGAAVPMACQDLSRIEDPPMPDGREQWLANVAHSQWSVAEISSGDMWRHLRGEGLMP